jgi:phosphoglycerate dehydrogenase-like enzyme
MKIWSNTRTLDGLVDDLPFTDDKNEADVALIGGKPLTLCDFPKLKGIFKCGVGRDNLPEAEAAERGVRCGFPAESTAVIIFEETASFATHLILQCLYSDIGDFGEWNKLDRVALLHRTVLVVGTGNIGSRVVKRLQSFAKTMTYDVLTHSADELRWLVEQADCVSLHMPLTDATRGFFDAEKLGWMKDGAALVNTARAAVVNEQALYDALAKKRMRAAFDVFWQEPYKGPLVELPRDRFLVSPHVASTCKEFISETANDFRRFIAELEASE